MYNKSSEFYDDIYASFKNYEKETKKILGIIQKNVPHCKNILDVACGTGEHDQHLAKKYSVDGIDLNSTFLKISKKKNPKGNYWRKDMTNFNLEKKYDVIVCLFSAIGYVRTLANLRKAVACFAKHLNSGGMMLIEPWVTPEHAQDGKTHLTGVETSQFKVCRMALTRVRGRISVVKFHYLFGKNKSVKFFTETHTLGLFTEKEMTQVFKQAGFQVAHDKTGLGLDSRGLYIAKKI